MNCIHWSTQCVYSAMNIRIEFGLKKCGILPLKIGKVKRSEGILIPDDGLIIINIRASLFLLKTEAT